MNVGFEKMHGSLIELHSISKELSSLLIKGEAAAVFKKMDQRNAILRDLQENSAGVDNKSKQNIEIKTIVNSIIDMDKKNMEVMQKKLNTVADSITDLEKEQKAIKNSRSVTMKDQKQLIDFLY
ncbi:hypothetical protein IIA28_00445 [candidate division KSB1 bacterium]|nr:hypothetical protein [candidate division KSB1 bacterium]MCH8019974.1 hypothetical protein [candidate division KSB1 bacterium]MCH8953777.1 hypothetical protein [candidate division KSB1 bacterium]